MLTDGFQRIRSTIGAAITSNYTEIESALADDVPGTSHGTCCSRGLRETDLMVVIHGKRMHVHNRRRVERCCQAGRVRILTPLRCRHDWRLRYSVDKCTLSLV